MLLVKYIITSFCLVIFFGINTAFCQQSSGPTLLIEVSKIDTLSIIDPNHDSILLIENKTLVQVVYFKLIKQSGKIKYKAKNFIATQIINSDHVCFFDFKPGHRYKMPAVQTKFSSEFVRAELKGWHYQTYCWEMPVEVSSF